MSIRGTKLVKGSLHILNNHTRAQAFEWTGKSWSTPGTGWGTKPSGMMALGWSYLRPANVPSPTPEQKP